MEEEELVDKRIEIAGRMLKAAGKVTPKDLGEAALICIQLACQLEDPEGYFQHVDLKIKEGILTLNANDILKRALKHADMNKAKPRIRKVTPFFFGIPCRPNYVCESRECVEFGDTAKEAYERWKRSMPTTRLGMWWARLWK